MEESGKTDLRKALKDIIEDKKERHRRAHEEIRKKNREREREKKETPEEQAKRLEKERERHRQFQEKGKKRYEQNPLLYHSDIIRERVSPYEQTFEDEQEERGDNMETRDELFDEEFADDMILQSMPKKPEGVTKTQWEKQIRQKRKEIREKRKQRKLDQDLEFHGTPERIFMKMIDEVACDCECEAEKMRAGIYCKTCKLFVILREYAIRLFKDAAEGRTSYV